MRPENWITTLQVRGKGFSGIDIFEEDEFYRCIPLKSKLEEVIIPFSNGENPFIDALSVLFLMIKTRNSNLDSNLDSNQSDLFEKEIRV